jgi:hypothetical protein
MARFTRKHEPLERSSSHGLVLGCPDCASRLDLVGLRDGDQAYWCHRCERGWRIGNLPDTAHMSKDAAREKLETPTTDAPPTPVTAPENTNPKRAVKPAQTLKPTNTPISKPRALSLPQTTPVRPVAPKPKAKAPKSEPRSSHSSQPEARAKRTPRTSTEPPAIREPRAARLEPPQSSSRPVQDELFPVLEAPRDRTKAASVQPRVAGKARVSPPETPRKRLGGRQEPDVKTSRGRVGQTSKQAVKPVQPPARGTAPKKTVAPSPNPRSEKERSKTSAKIALRQPTKSRGAKQVAEQSKRTGARASTPTTAPSRAARNAVSREPLSKPRQRQSTPKTKSPNAKARSSVPAARVPGKSPAKTAVPAKRSPAPRSKPKSSPSGSAKSNARKTPAAHSEARKTVRGKQSANTPAARGAGTRKSTTVSKSTGKASAKPVRTGGAKPTANRATKPATKPAPKSPRAAERTPVRTRATPTRTERQRLTKRQPTASTRHQTSTTTPRVTPAKTRSNTPQPRAKSGASPSKPRVTTPLKRSAVRK